MPEEKPTSEEEKGEVNAISDIAKYIGKINPRYFDKYNSAPRPVFQTKLIYDSTSEGLEPIYFWILDFMRDARGYKNTEKIADNFVASPGSGYFAELGARATRMQDESMKILGSVNTVIKSIINIIYDLKEFEIRLSHYNAAKSKNKAEKEAGVLALKQIWMDNVDVKRGRGSINMLTYELSFSTLRDAFMIAKSLEDVDKIDLNDRVKRILKPRLAEFFEWWNRSEAELKKRFAIEKTYLKSQVSSLKIYSRWAKPYLRAAEQLSGRDFLAGKSPDIVNTFNTMVLELAVIGKKGITVKDEAYNKNLPEAFLKLKAGKNYRNYYKCVLIDLRFRTIPRRVSEQGHYAFGGRADIDFIAYALNEDELAALSQEMDKSDIDSALKLVEGVTTESLDQLKDDIEKYMKDESTLDKEKKEKTEIENPFVALFSFAKKKSEESKEKKSEPKKIDIKNMKKDNFYEGVIRKFAEAQAAEDAFKIMDTLKKAYGMASIPGGIDFVDYMQERDNPRDVKNE